MLVPLAPLEAISLPLAAAHGLVLIEDAVAGHPLPPFDNSAMDGYAVRRTDVQGATEGAPVVLDVLGEVRAGGSNEVEVRSGGAVRIMTGAAIPRGADAVVPVEVTSETGGAVSIAAAPPPGGHIRPAGDDIRAGATVVTAGEQLGPGELAVLASLGLSPIEVHRRPRVAIVTTGDELVDPEAELRPGIIRDSNRIAMASLVSEAGAEASKTLRAADTAEAVESTLAEAAADADLIVVAGGVSVGRYDFVRSTVEQLGAVDFWRVAMQPGKPVVSGLVKDTPMIGLPGNPVSVHVSFEQFARPAIRRLLGCRSLLRPRLRATLTAPLDKRPGRRHFVRVKLAFGREGVVASPTGGQGSHIQSSLVGCDGLAIFAEEATHLDAGATVEVEVWRVPDEIDRG